MKKQSGFTLIELLLVIAIIGIISAIAVPAFIGQRDSAKDKAAQANCASILTAFMAAINKVEDDGTTVGSVDITNINDLVATNDVNTALVPEIYREQNPWNKAERAYEWKGVLNESTTFDTDIKDLAKPANKGQVQLAAGTVGGNLVVGAAVYLNKPVKTSTGSGSTSSEADHVMVKIQGIG
jgi:type IV pilus assembly protein PilA